MNLIFCRNTVVSAVTTSFSEERLKQGRGKRPLSLPLEMSPKYTSKRYQRRMMSEIQLQKLKVLSSDIIEECYVQCTYTKYTQILAMVCIYVLHTYIHTYILLCSLPRKLDLNLFANISKNVWYRSNTMVWYGIHPILSKLWSNCVNFIPLDKTFPLQKTFWGESLNYKIPRGVPMIAVPNMTLRTYWLAERPIEVEI